MTREDAPSFDAALRAGVAVYNAGYHHAAHDAWEATWLDLEAGGRDERLLHGLIQFTAAVHHGYRANWAGVVGLAGSARDYLADLPGDYRGVDVAGVRDYLGRVAHDPVAIERLGPRALRYEGCALSLADLDLDAALVAAPLVAEAEGDDAEAIERAVGYARDDLATGEEGSAFVTLVLDYVHESAHRATVARRLADRTARRRSRETDVDGLFEAREE